MNTEHDYQVTWAVQTLKNIHQDVMAKASLIEELERAGADANPQEIEELRGAVRERARALRSLLGELQKQQAATAGRDRT